MSSDGVLRAWEERVIVGKKGNRIVHYILRDNTGNSLVAVIGRERSVYHMVYTVSPDYLRVFGSTSTVHAGKKWQSRREVVEFLISLVSRGGPIFADSCENVQVSTGNQVSKRTKSSCALLANFVAKREPTWQRPEPECRVLLPNTNEERDMQGLNLKKRFITRYNEEMSHGRYS